ncbi:hypothetical protein Tco_0182682, partial [Tanacetum coccineum]
MLYISFTSRVGSRRLVAASANRVFGNGGGRRHDMPNMCGSDHGRGGNFRQGRGDVGEHGRGQGKKCGVDKISKIHYYTKEQKSSVYGTEDVSITPFTSDLSAAEDGIVTSKQ